MSKSLQKIFLLTITLLLICSSCNAGEKKEVKASEIIKLIKKEKHINIVDKIIMDDLNFAEINEAFIVSANVLQTEIASNIFFSNCIFMGKVTSNGKYNSIPIQTIFRNNLIFIACDFRDEVDLSSSSIIGAINCSQSIYREDAKFNNIHVRGKDNYFVEVKAEKGFSMIYAAFQGNLYMTNADFLGKFSMQESAFEGKFSLNNSNFKENANFDLINVGKNAFFNYVTFEKNANFSFAYFMHDVEFINTTFENKATFEKTFFNCHVQFENIDMDNDIILKDTYFNTK